MAAAGVHLLFRMEHFTRLSRAGKSVLHGFLIAAASIVSVTRSLVIFYSCFDRKRQETCFLLHQIIMRDDYRTFVCPGSASFRPLGFWFICFQTHVFSCHTNYKWWFRDEGKVSQRPIFPSSNKIQEGDNITTAKSCKVWFSCVIKSLIRYRKTG